MDQIIIIDGNSLINRAFYALPPLRASDGKIYNAVFGCCNIITKLIQEYKPKYMVVAFDHARKTFRNEIYADYKGTRKAMPDDLASQMPVFKNALTTMGIKYVEQAGIEADDIIGTLAKRFEDRCRCVILTGDRDCLQLINENTEVWLTKHGISNIVSENLRQLKEDFGLTPSQVIDLKGLMGDASDNIPGVPGVGEKTAMKLLAEYGTLQNIYKNIEKIPGKLGEKLAESRELAEISYTLATIKTDCEIDCELADCVYEFPFSESVRDMFLKYEFKSLSKKDSIFKFDEKIDENSAKITKISVKNVKNALKIVKNAKIVAFEIAEVGIHFAIDNAENFVIDDADWREILPEFKEIFEDKNITKILYSKKAMLHKLHELDINLHNALDVSLGVYLINSNVREDDPRFMFDFLHLPVSSLATSLLIAWEYVTSELPKKGLDKLYFDIELPLVDVLFDMEITGINVNTQVLDELEPKYKAELEKLTQEIFEHAGQKFNINSPKQLGKVLFEDMKLTDKGNKRHSTAVDKLTEIAYLHPIIPLILRHRKVAKMLSTYIEGIKQYVREDGKIHTIFNQTLTVTGRLSSMEPNLQNIPIRTDEGKELRKMFVASEGNVLLCADYSQIELRLMAHYSGDYNLCMAYRRGADIHTLTASQIFGVPGIDVTPAQRRAAKAVNFGIIYGISPFGLANNIGNITPVEAREYMDAYFATYPTIQTFMQKSVMDAKTQGYVSTLFGRIRNIDLSSESKRENSFGERAAMNMPLQGSASDIIKIAMIQIFETMKAKNLKTKMILQIHDELIFDVPKNELAQVFEIVKNKMENVVELHVPLTVDINYGENWYECDK